MREPKVGDLVIGKSVKEYEAQTSVPTFTDDSYQERIAGKVFRIKEVVHNYDNIIWTLHVEYLADPTAVWCGGVRYSNRFTLL